MPFLPPEGNCDTRWTAAGAANLPAAAWGTGASRTRPDGWPAHRIIPGDAPPPAQKKPRARPLARPFSSALPERTPHADAAALAAEAQNLLTPGGEEGWDVLNPLLAALATGPVTATH